jgi:hypothetical protein
MLKFCRLQAGIEALLDVHHSYTEVAVACVIAIAIADGFSRVYHWFMGALRDETLWSDRSFALEAFVLWPCVLNVLGSPVVLLGCDLVDFLSQV